eukprot:scaffold113324_cov45-Phaeocystis_antarctica.AAC.2
MAAGSKRGPRDVGCHSQREGPLRCVDELRRQRLGRRHVRQQRQVQGQAQGRHRCAGRMPNPSPDPHHSPFTLTLTLGLTLIPTP